MKYFVNGFYRQVGIVCLYPKDTYVSLGRERQPAGRGRRNKRR
jgi:hypothetical protein